MTAAPKKKLNRADFMFSQKTGETLTKKPGDVFGKDFAIRFLEDCTVQLFDHTAQIMVDKCNNTTFILGPVKGSIFFRDCTNCTVHVACGQFRCRDFKDSTVYLYAANDPVIEASSGLKFAPYNIAYPKLGEHAKEAGLSTDVNKWELVFDFSPTGENNFSQLAPEEFQLINKTIEGFEGEPELVFGFPSRYGGQLSDTPPESSERAAQPGGMQAFGITTGMAAAQQAVDKQTTEQVQQPSPAAQQEQADETKTTIIASDAQAAFQDHQPFPESFAVDNQSDILGNTAAQEPSFLSQQAAEPSAPQMNWQSSEPAQEQNSFQNAFGADDPFAEQAQPYQQFGQPAQQPQAPVVGPDGEEYTEEEQVLMQQAEQRRQQRQQQCFENTQNEMAAKQEKRNKGFEAIQQWQQERKNQITQRRRNNQDLEENAKAEELRMKETLNPWERVVANVDFKTSVPGAKDVSRMKSAMIARKSDLTKAQPVRPML